LTLFACGWSVGHPPKKRTPKVGLNKRKRGGLGKKGTILRAKQTKKNRHESRQGKSQKIKNVSIKKPLARPKNETYHAVVGTLGLLKSTRGERQCGTGNLSGEQR